MHPDACRIRTHVMSIQTSLTSGNYSREEEYYLGQYYKVRLILHFYVVADRLLVHQRNTTFQNLGQIHASCNIP